MQLKENTIAPAFTGMDYRGKEVSLSDYKGKKVLLTFFRYATCPFCNLRIHKMISRYDGYKAKGVDVLGIMESPAERILRNSPGRQDPPFALIADPELKLYTQYGLAASWLGLGKALITRPGEAYESIIKNGTSLGRPDGKMAMLPAEFFINENGLITKAYYGRDIGDHIPFEEINQWIGI